MAPKQTKGEPARSWIVHTISPGETVNDSVIVSNADSAAITAVVQALDGVNTLDGAYSLIEDAKNNQGVGTWIKLEKNEITIPGNSSKEIKFSISVPANAPVGEQSGGIVAYAKPDNAVGKINLTLRLGTRVYITVPGEVHRDIKIDRFVPQIKGGKLVLVLSAKNASNVNIKPTIEFKLSGLFGSQSEKIEAPGIYLPNAPIYIEYAWPKRLSWTAHYEAEATIHTNETTEYSADKSSHQLPDQTFSTHLNFWIGGRNLITVLLVLLLGWFYARGSIFVHDLKAYRIKTKVYRVREGEGLSDVAENTDMPASVIARFNSISEITKLTSGQTLLIPLGVLTPEELRKKRETDPYPNIWRYLFLLK
jgi:hypothetical protein